MIRTLLSQAPEGMIITGGDQTKACQHILQKSRIPIVQIMEALENPLDMNIGFSHSQAGYDVAMHLVEQGYSRIGFIGARMDSRVQQRLQGFKLALEKHDMFQKNYVVTTPEPTSIAVGGQLLKSLMANTKGVIDAVFCANDDLGLGALFESQRMNINVPGDLAICGFNDIEAAQYVNPSMSSVYVGRYEMGVKAAEMVINRLNGKMDEPNVVDMGYQIKKRQSTTR